jgi:enoyl-CoA hydratase
MSTKLEGGVLTDVSEAAFSTLRVERDGSILRITIDRPPRNTVDDALHTDLARLFALLKYENQARVIILTGAGKIFSAGGDYDWFPTLRGAERLDTLRQHAKQLIWDLLDIEIPIVAAVNGPAIGLGASIALLCDVIFMAESAVIADPHVRVGIVAGDGGTAIWPLAVGPARAKEFLLTGDAVSAPDAERMGLVNHVFPDDELAERATAFAQRLADGAPLALRATKMCVNKLVKETLNVAFDAATALEMVTFMSEDHEEALQARREKRTPRFQGR